MATNMPEGTGGGTNQGQVQTVVVVQQPQGAIQTGAGDGRVRASRWAYLVFMIGFMIYHFFAAIAWLLFTFAAGAIADEGVEDADGYAALFFFCGCLPSTIAFIWGINDSTVFCANPGGKEVEKICCCECISGPAMSVPMIIASVLRLIFWAFWCIILSDLASDSDLAVLHQYIFFFFLVIFSFDCGPLILVAIDWWWFYGKRDYDALFGTTVNPMRCVVGLCIIIGTFSWALIALFQGTGELWLVIMHAVFATVLLVYCAFLNFTGQVTGNMVGNTMFKFGFFALGGIMGVCCLITWIYIFIGMGYLWPLVFYGIYYNGLMVPIVWACVSFKDEASAAV